MKGFSFHHLHLFRNFRKVVIGGGGNDVIRIVKSLEARGNHTKFNIFPPSSGIFLVIYFFFSVIFIIFAAVFRGCPSN